MSKQHRRISETLRRQARMDLWARDSRGGVALCCYCACELTEETFTMEHVKRLADGGTNDLGNLEIACGQCNNEKGVRQERKRQRPRAHQPRPRKATRFARGKVFAVRSAP